jgi:hypothetical protein
MNGKSIILEPDLLVAYVDGELPPDRRAEVEAALVHDAEAWESVRLLRLSASAAARAFAPVLSEPVPARLIAGAEPARVAGPSPRARSRGWLMPLAASLAALAIGLGAGYSFRGHGIGDGDADGYVPAAVNAADPLAERFESVLLAALEKGNDGQSFTYDVQNVGQGHVVLGKALITSFGAACREFHRDQTRGGVSRADNGVACRAPDKSWSVMILPAAG